MIVPNSVREYLTFLHLGQVSMEMEIVLGDAVKMKDADVIVTKAPQAHALQ